MSGDLAPNISSRDKTLAIVAKNYKKNKKQQISKFSVPLIFYLIPLLWYIFFFSWENLIKKNLKTRRALGVCTMLVKELDKIKHKSLELIRFWCYTGASMV